IQAIVFRLSPNDVRRQIANAHTIFNLINVLVQFPFAGLLVEIVKWIIPGKEDELIEGGLKYLDPRIIETPSIALGQADKEVFRMGKLVEDNLINASKAFRDKDEKAIERVFSQEQIINSLEQGIIEYLVDLSNAPLTDEEHNRVNTLMNIVNDLERVGDHADNIAELSELSVDENLEFSEGAIDEFDHIFGKGQEVLNKTLDAFMNMDPHIAKEVLLLEEEVDFLEQKYRASHINRLNKMLCTPSAGVVFLDILSNLERVSDHSSNIALYVLDEYKE
ncbi:MAG: Na/Pi cotransporter family protein, partial [Tissierellia bacterium]|nr:Na/Pi cotransporter family protein [Tissierellia bacterium]